MDVWIKGQFWVKRKLEKISEHKMWKSPVYLYISSVPVNMLLLYVYNIDWPFFSIERIGTVSYILLTVGLYAT